MFHTIPEHSTNWSFICKRPWPLSGEERMNCVHIYPPRDTEPAEGHLLILSWGLQVEPAQGPARGAHHSVWSWVEPRSSDFPCSPTSPGLADWHQHGFLAHKVPPGLGAEGVWCATWYCLLGKTTWELCPLAQERGAGRHIHIHCVLSADYGPRTLSHVHVQAHTYTHTHHTQPSAK